MTELASAAQLRGAFLRWALFMVPGIVLLGLLSGVVAGSGAGNPWFEGLIKPSTYPPPPTFAVVWTVLYVLMGVAVSMVASARGAAGRQAALIAFAVQLALNLAWSPLFFSGHQIGGALALIVALDVAVIAVIALFWRVRPVAALLLAPYLAWILFASVLTYHFLVANPYADGREISRPVQRIEL